MVTARRRSRLHPSIKQALIRAFVGGVSARVAAQTAGVNRHTATLFYHKLRELIAAKLDAEAPFSIGEVEVDESYFGGIRKGKRGRGAAGKVVVFGLLKRAGKVYVTIIPDTRSRTLAGIIRERVRPDSVVYTDAYRSYDTLDVSEFRHRRINHQQAFVARGATTSTASRTFGARPSGICAATTASPGRTSTCSSRSASGGSTIARQAVC